MKILAALHPAPIAPASDGSLAGWLWLLLALAIVVVSGIYLTSRR